MARPCDDEALVALQKAIQLEQEGQAFYRKAAERTANPRGAATFRSLAEDEVLHEKILRRQMEALTGGEGWCELPEVGEVEGDLPASLFPKGEEGLKKAISPEASDLDALLFALQIESQSYNFYRDLALRTEDPNGRRMYQHLARAEQGHFDLLMLNYEHLTTTGMWPS